jgi:hypothetical protein
MYYQVYKNVIEGAQAFKNLSLDKRKAFRFLFQADLEMALYEREPETREEISAVKYLKKELAKIL